MPIYAICLSGAPRTDAPAMAHASQGPLIHEGVYCTPLFLDTKPGVADRRYYEYWEANSESEAAYELLDWYNDIYIHSISELEWSM